MFSEAARAGKRFRVIVADGRPRFEGRAMARHMVAAGIECSYIQVRNTIPKLNYARKLLSALNCQEVLDVWRDPKLVIHHRSFLR